MTDDQIRATLGSGMLTFEVANAWKVTQHEARKVLDRAYRRGVVTKIVRPGCYKLWKPA